jgi:hypothetical protein
VQAVGVLLTGNALDNLPAAMSDGHHCFDLNNDGTLDLMSECSGGHERILPMPSEASRPTDLPFKWTLLNWNPHGHIPPGVYDKPHFDIHFVMDTIENVFAISPDHAARRKSVAITSPGPGYRFRPATCTPISKTWRPSPRDGQSPDRPDGVGVPRRSVHADVDLRDVRGSRHVLRGNDLGPVPQVGPDVCTPIKRVPAVAVAGRSTRSCVRYSKDRAEYTVSLEVSNGAKPAGR